METVWSYGFMLAESKSFKSKLAAVTHVDDTARAQLVLKDNEKFYKLIESFGDLTEFILYCPHLTKRK